MNRYVAAQPSAREPNEARADAAQQRSGTRTLRLNLGCGSTTPDGWENVDYALGARLARIPGFSFVNARLRLFDVAWARRIRIHDLRRPFPWADGSVDTIYSSHTFEHLTREEGHAFLDECHRVLRAGGTLRLVVPDLAAIVDRYRAGALPADRFIEALDVLPASARSAWKSRFAALLAFPHKCMYDEPALLGVMANHGFDASARAPFDSRIADIRCIELTERTGGAVIVEGVKTADRRAVPMPT